MIRHDRIGDDIGLFDRAMKILAGASTMEPDYSKGSDNMGTSISESNRHYIADEELGGIEREYAVIGARGGRARVGDYVVSSTGRICKVTKTHDDGDVNVDTLAGEYNGEYTRSFYKTLSPTGIIRHNGERYRLVEDIEVEIGGNILIIGAVMTGGKYSVGDVLTVDEVGNSGVYVNSAKTENGPNNIGYISYDEYIVLEPVIDEPTADAPTESQPDLVDLVIRLTRKVAELEKRVNDADYKAGQALTSTSQFAEKLTDSEISVKLDGRTVARVITGSADE
ncbi:hypothetical protein JOC34_002840 [Virgibacillus halotolerans]|uniref:hypothetical protein n=1 Tax=Virgibacillus halotolerans TaxID=1071053 RepID=UPI0019615277|nr:hypothetical protein [Virgibacillus halotolerans]MBM7600449.1 hypothetical protein [Virgibacillus halotolerans]